MDKVRNAVDWLLWSSVNKDKVSLTLKMTGAFLVLWGVGDAQVIEDLSGKIGVFMVHLAQLVSLAVGIYALVRKIWNTI